MISLDNKRGSSTLYHLHYIIPVLPFNKKSIDMAKMMSLFGVVVFFFFVLVS